MRDHFQINGYQFEILLNEQTIQTKIEEMARSINTVYYNSRPIILIILKGAAFFGIDLCRNLKFDFELEFLSPKSYGSSMQSSGDVILNSLDSALLLSSKIKDRDIIIIEDIIDSGNTIEKIINNITLSEPRSVSIAALFCKKEKYSKSIQIDHIGFEIPDKFIIGYGLDYNEIGRNLKNVYVKCD